MKSPAFQFYPGDFLGGNVATYSLDEIGLYTVLLAFDWSLTGLPVEPEKLAKLARISVRKFSALWATVGENFTLRDGRYFNPRLELERAKQAANRKKKQDAANSRWNADADADALQTQCPSSSVALSVSPSVTASSSSAPVIAFDPVRELLARIPEASRPAWAAVIDTAKQGMQGPVMTQAQINRACEDYFGNGNLERPSLRHFRAYLETAATAPTERPTVPRGNPADGAEAAWETVLGMVPQWQRREVTAEVHQALAPPIRAGISKIGGFKVLSETRAEQLTWTKKEFLAAYRAAANTPAKVPA